MILITGATGAVGSEVVKRLSAAGVPARAVTRRPEKVTPLPHIEFVRGDFDDPTSMRGAAEGAERAFLLTNSTDRAEQQQTAFVRVAKEAGVRHLVVLSQLHANPGSSLRFLRYHGAVEEFVRAAGLTFTFLQPNLYMQALLGLRDSVREKGAIFLAGGDARVSAVDTRDLADVAVAALTGAGHEGKAYPLTGPAALSFAEMAGQVGAAIGRPVAYIDVPPEAMRAALVGLGTPEWQADGLTEEFAMYRRGGASGVESGVQEALARPPRSFAEFARDNAPQFS